MRTNNKAQVSLEYLIVTSLVLLFLVVMGVIIYEKYTEWADLRTHLTGRSAANTMAESINQVVTEGDGYWQTLSIRSRYPGDEFNITFKRNEPTVFIDLHDYARASFNNKCKLLSSDMHDRRRNDDIAA